MHLSSLYNLSNTMNQSATPLMDHNRRTTMKRSMNALSSKFDDDFKHVQNHGSDSKKHKCKWKHCQLIDYFDCMSMCVCSVVYVDYRVNEIERKIEDGERGRGKWWVTSHLGGHLPIANKKWAIVAIFVHINRQSIVNCWIIVYWHTHSIANYNEFASRICRLHYDDDGW